MSKTLLFVLLLSFCQAEAILYIKQSYLTGIASNMLSNTFIFWYPTSQNSVTFFNEGLTPIEEDTYALLDKDLLKNYL